MVATIKQPADSDRLQRLAGQFDRALERLEQSSAFAKSSNAFAALDVSRRLLSVPGGVDYLAKRIPELDQAGIFADSDWNDPALLQANLVPGTLAMGDQAMVTYECLSELRWLAIARGDYHYPGIAAEQALFFLREVLALNLDLVFDRATEAAREKRLVGVNEVFAYLVDHIGYGDILEQVVEEVWRILRERPIKVDHVKTMITKLAVCLADPEIGSQPRGAERLVSALFGPSTITQNDPGLDSYIQTLETLDVNALKQEATAFARAMSDTGLVSPYHPVLLRFLLKNAPDLIPQALALSSTGTDVLLTYRDLVNELIDKAIHPETSQAVYGLSCILERGLLYEPPVAPGFWRQIQMVLHPDVEAQINAIYGTSQSAGVHLLAGLINVLGIPLGIGQGHNPTCQSARSISMWAYNDPDYLMQLLAWAARDGEIIMQFEGVILRSRELAAGLAGILHLDLDPVSLVLVPHLDRIYIEMGRLSAGRGEDPHKWVNPEFHGWWVGRGFAIAVDVASGNLENHEQFIRDFYAAYHPYYNGNQPVIHPQPAGVAVTDSSAEFVGWHAITIIRVTLDPAGEMRAYFYNPNNDSNQDWGNGVKVSTEGHGEYYGESSLPVAELASRLYIFHYDLLETGDPHSVPAEEINTIRAMAENSWAAERLGETAA